MSNNNFPRDVYMKDINALMRKEMHQLHMFLTEVRPVGEEKSELFPEPQYFTAAFASLGVNMAYTIDKIIERTGNGAEWGRRCKKILSPAGAVQLPGIPWIVNWAREILMLDPDTPGQNIDKGMIFDDGVLTFSDIDVANCMLFSKSAVEEYRSDGQFYPSREKALGSNFRILNDSEAKEIAAETTKLNSKSANEVLKLMAAIRALSFLMESETREALMMHGPYETGENGHQLIFFECSDLRWTLWPKFPLTGGVRWELPKTQFPYANLAIALVLKDVRISADRVGTLYINELTAENVVSASLLTRGNDEFMDEGLTQVDVGKANQLEQLCDEIQESMFLQIASWNLRQRMEAAVRQEETLLLRMLASAGYSREEIEREQSILSERHERVWGASFNKILNCPSQELPFFLKLSKFVNGEIKQLYKPLILYPKD